MFKNKKNICSRAFALIEVVVSTVLLAIVLASLANIFMVGKRYIVHSRSRMAAGELGRVFVEPLQQDVRQDTWDTAANGLAVTVPGTPRLCDGIPQQPNCPALPAQRTLDSILYTGRYTISADVAAAPLLRRAQVRILWNE